MSRPLVPNPLVLCSSVEVAQMGFSLFVKRNRLARWGTGHHHEIRNSLAVLERAGWTVYPGS